MGKLSEQEDVWQAEATASAVASARSMAQSQERLANTPAGKLSDQQWGWLISAILFSWIQTRYRQAIQEGLAAEAHVTKMKPSPRDSAIVQSILPTLADQAPIDWGKPLVSWSRNEMRAFIDLAWALIDEARAGLEAMPDTILHKPAAEKKEPASDGLDIPDFLRRDAEGTSKPDADIPF